MKKSPNPTDKHVGARVRMRRMMISMSQEKLGEALGLTFQQVQKYEKGTNRIGASRLQQIATILQVPVSFFFEGNPISAASVNATASNPTFMDDFLSTSDGIAIARAFTAITDPKTRHRVRELVEIIANAAPAPHKAAA